MAFDTSNTKTNVEALIALLDNSQDIKYLLLLQKAAFGVGISSASQTILDSKIQAIADTQGGGATLTELLLANKAMGATQAVTNTYYQGDSVSTSVNYLVPANAVSCLVTGGAGGGDGGGGAGSGGGGGGAQAIDFEIPVTGGGTLDIVVGGGRGVTITIGALTIEAGKNGSSSGGGAGGRVLLAGAVIPPSATVIHGGSGGSQQGGNGEANSSGTYNGGIGDSGNESGGGGASYAFDGASGLNGAAISSYGAGSSGWQGTNSGGGAFPTVQLNFKIVEVV